MQYPKIDRSVRLCRECGHKIRYGRVDKKFCCDSCRTKYNNSLVREGRAYRRKVMKALADNYEILDGLLREGITSVDLLDIVSMGFVTDVVTSHHKVRRHDEYACFDIKYVMTQSRISSIMKISLNLQVGKKLKY